MREDATVAERTPERAPESKAEQSWPRKIRTTLEPHKDLEVGEAEFTDLSRLGLIKEGN